MLKGVPVHRHRYLVEQFQICCAGRILGYFSQGPTFFVREYLEHRQDMPQSRVKYHGLPVPPSKIIRHETWCSKWNFWSQQFFQRNFSLKFWWHWKKNMVRVIGRENFETRTVHVQSYSTSTIVRAHDSIYISILSIVPHRGNIF